MRAQKCYLEEFQNQSALETRFDRFFSHEEDTLLVVVATFSSQHLNRIHLAKYVLIEKRVKYQTEAHSNLPKNILFFLRSPVRKFKGLGA